MLCVEIYLTRIVKLVSGTMILVTNVCFIKKILSPKLMMGGWPIRIDREKRYGSSQIKPITTDAL